jgi:hypothetical protein
MKRVLVGAAMSLTLASAILCPGRALAGSKTIVNNSDDTVTIVVLTRCDPGTDITCTAGAVKLVVGKKGKSKTLTYPTQFLNQFVVHGGENCAVTVNVRGDSGDNTMNTNSILTVSDLASETNKALDHLCTVTGSNP